MTEFKNVSPKLVSCSIDKSYSSLMPKIGAVFLGIWLAMATSVSEADCGHLCDRDWMSSATLADVKVELEKEIDLSASSSTGKTALHHAAEVNGDPAVASLLLDWGANLEARTSYGFTPLHRAAGGVGIEGWTILNDIYGIQMKKYSAMKSLYIIEKYLDTGRFQGNHPAVVELLLDRGADISATNHRGQTTLHQAAALNSNLEVLDLLLERGAVVDARNESGLTPLHVAAWSNMNSDTVQLFVERGADINSKNNSMKVSPIHLAALNLNPDVIRKLLKLGANIEARDIYGKQPVHAVAEHSLPEAVDLLVDNGADLNSRDLRNRTPLHYALESNPNPDVAIKLIETGADLDIQDSKGESPRSIGLSPETLDKFRRWSEESSSHLHNLLEQRPLAQ